MGMMLALMLVVAAPAFAQDDFQDFDDLQDTLYDWDANFDEAESGMNLHIDIAVREDTGDRVVVITDELTGAQVVANIPAPPPPPPLPL